MASAEPASANEEQLLHPKKEYGYQKIERRGPVITWAIENFSHWYASSKENDIVSSGQFAVADGTHWRMCLQRTFEPVLVRDSTEEEPTRVTVGFQFSLLTDTGEHCHSEPKTETFREGTRHAGAWSLAADDLLKQKDPRDTLTLQCHLWRDCNTSGPLSRECSVTLELQIYKSVSEDWFNLFMQKKGGSSSTRFDVPKSDSTSTKKDYQSNACITFNYSQFEDNSIQRAGFQVNHNLRDGSTTMKCRWSLLDTSGHVTEKQSEVMLHHFVQEGAVSTPWVLEREYLLQRKESVLRNERSVLVRFEVVCACSLEETEDYRGNESLRSQESNYTSRHRLRVGSSLSTDIGQLLSASDGCPGDMSVVSDDGTSLSVHRDVLCARSPVFAAMMERDMAERQTGQVRFSDWSKETVEQFILFCYTGQLKTEHQIDCGTLFWLYAAGEKYQVVSLKKRCSVLLRSRLSKENTCDFLEFSELFSDRELRGRALEVISRHKEILVSEDFLELSHRKKKMAEDILNEVRLLGKES